MALGQKVPCWLATTNDGRFAYTANAGSGTIGSFGIARDGMLSLLNRTAAGAIDSPPDLGLSTDSKFLYLRQGTGAVSGFRVEHDGSLTSVGFVTGLPADANGNRGALENLRLRSAPHANREQGVLGTIERQQPAADLLPPDARIISV